MKRTLAIAALLAFPLVACGGSYDFKGVDGAIDHCKNVIERNASWSGYFSYHELVAEDFGGGSWSVAGTVDLTAADGTPISRQVSCWVEFDKGMSDDASVRANIDKPA